MKSYSVCCAIVLSAAEVLGLSAHGYAKENSNNSSNTAELQGCLRRSEGQYFLVDRDGVAKVLSNNSKLKNLAEHEIKVTGKPMIRTIDTTPPGGASSAIEKPYFEVKTVTEISPNCSGYPQ
jgi:hypothetical protein